MVIKQHLSGVAIAYNPLRKSREDGGTSPGRPQGSLYGQQKRAIADAVEYMRRYGRHKPLIFVLTSPGFTDLANEKPFVSRWINNMRMRHGLQNYVWVRELTGHGYPHFHFIADVPRFDAVKQSLLWSSYFESQAKNSIRVGTYPKNGRRTYYVNSPRMAFYLSKYIGKGVDGRKTAAKSKIKTFAISQELARDSAPCIYGEKMVETITGRYQRVWEIEAVPDWLETEGYIEPANYRWMQPNEMHNVFIGTRKNVQRKR